MTRLPDPSPEPLEEQSLFDLLGPLHDLQAPLATQIANRQSLANVLHERPLQSASRARPWWRRSVSVPIPLAAAILLLAVIFVMQQRASSQLARDAVSGPAQQPQALLPRNGDSREARLAALQPSANCRSRESGMYLSGIGSLNSKVVYLDKGFLP